MQNSTALGCSNKMLTISMLFKLSHHKLEGDSCIVLGPLLFQQEKNLK